MNARATVRSLLALCALLGGCGPDRVTQAPGRDLGADLAMPATSEGPSVDLAIAPPADLQAVCGHASLAVATIVATASSPANCEFVDTPQTKTGTLSYPCGGGAATATFGALTFTGQVTGTMVSLTLERSFSWSDGCDWRNQQRITGDLTSATLTYGYEEAPNPGQSGCLASCTGDATVTTGP